jgi:hypothetical protein
MGLEFEVDEGMENWSIRDTRASHISNEKAN